MRQASSLPASLRSRRFYAPCVLAAFALLASCTSGGVPRSGPSGALDVKVAPLTLEGIVDACYALTVKNEAGETVWSREGLCADQFGDGRGSLSYVGTCDATDDDHNGTASNAVVVVVENLYIDGAGGPIPLAPADWNNPCPAPDGCTLGATCLENEDAAVVFNLTIMRKAYQGFFDVAVNFENIFCSAKVDCSYPGEGGGNELSINLVMDPATGQRVPSLVFAFACTDGNPPGNLSAGAENATHLYLDDLVLACGDTNYTIDPSAGPGNLYPGGVGAPAPIVQAMEFEGRELITNGGQDADKYYWNVALGWNGAFFEPGTPTCHLHTRATGAHGPLAEGATPPDVDYPYIDVDVTVNDGYDIVCTQHPLDGAGAHDGVATVYTGLAPGGGGFANMRFGYEGAPFGGGIRTEPVTSFVQIASGRAHSCAITNHGALYCWGFNSQGQVGDGSTIDRMSPVRVGSESGWTAVTAGSVHTCGIRGGALYCWGAGNFGALGNGTTDNYPIPHQVGSATDWISVGAGEMHTCAVNAGGALYCWGTGTEGQLGDGTTDPHPSPVPVSPSSGWTAVSAGVYFTCGLNAGHAYCWGQNIVGQVGDGTTTTPRTSPVEVVGGASDWSTLSAGNFHACGLRGGHLYCWGDGSWGELGTGTYDSHPSPVQVGTDGGWTALTASLVHTCAVRAGALYCWGGGQSGQLGSGTIWSLPSPSQVGTSVDWTTAAGGRDHTCGLRAGKVYCWGLNIYGQLGSGSTDTPREPVRVGLASDWNELATGYQHTCGLRAGALYCWGLNGNGQLGDGTTVTREVPIQVGTDTDWSVIAAGGYHSCGIRNGELYCWGGGWWGQLGDGSNNGYTSPVRIGSASDWSGVWTGAMHTCGLHTTGELDCWGYNDRGQLGDGSTANHNTPTQVGTTTDWSFANAGEAHTCGVRGGGLYCWGRNDWGQLGDGSTTQHESPTAVGSATDWTVATGGWLHRCGLRSGDLYCWGAGFNGVLGDGSYSQQTSPIRVGSASDWSEVSAGTYHTCGREGGVLYCWGNSVSGGVGDGTLWPRGTPYQVGSATDWSAVRVGAAHTCGIRSGELYCWGANEYGQVAVHKVWAPEAPIATP